MIAGGGRGASLSMERNDNVESANIELGVWSGLNTESEDIEAYDMDECRTNDADGSRSAVKDGSEEMATPKPSK
jgi:hypothetical protein